MILGRGYRKCHPLSREAERRIKTENLASNDLWMTPQLMKNDLYLQDTDQKRIQCVTRFLFGLEFRLFSLEFQKCLINIDLFYNFSIPSVQPAGGDTKTDWGANRGGKPKSCGHARVYESIDDVSS